MGHGGMGHGAWERLTAFAQFDDAQFDDAMMPCMRSGPCLNLSGYCYTSRDMSYPFTHFWNCLTEKHLAKHQAFYQYCLAPIAPFAPGREGG